MCACMYIVYVLYIHALVSSEMAHLMKTDNCIQAPLYAVGLLGVYCHMGAFTIRFKMPQITNQYPSQ